MSQLLGSSWPLRVDSVNRVAAPSISLVPQSTAHEVHEKRYIVKTQLCQFEVGDVMYWFHLGHEIMDDKIAKDGASRQNLNTL